MHSDWQTWVALGVVAVAAALLLRSAWGRRRSHDGCGCPGSRQGREIERLKRQVRRRG